MCGIVGSIEKGGTPESIFREMMSIMKHRGPDADGLFCKGDMSLGHVRLSIIDLQTGDQPMFSRDGRLAVVFNGEIYNYRELREELKSLGQQFVTESDTEVLLNGYLQWSVDWFHRLNGIFSFILMDMKDMKWILVRDHYGIKPLHYYDDGQLFIAASEQKSILCHPGVKREVNWRSFHEHLNLRYTPGDDTLFQGIKRLRPGHYLVWEKGRTRLERYFQQSMNINPRLREEQAMEELQYHLKNAVQRQLISDVPLGVYLSGGMDSSTLVQKMRELNVDHIRTFTLGFNEPSDEFPDAEKIARHFATEHHTKSLAMDPLTAFPEVLWHAEEPKINLLQGFNMSSFVKEDISVVLGGLGGDELLAGYDIHTLLYPVSSAAGHVPRWMMKLGAWKSDLLFRLQTKYGKLSHDEYRRGIQALLAIGDMEKQYLILRNVWDMDQGNHRMIYSESFRNKIAGELGIRVRDQFTPYFEQVHKYSGLDQVLYTEFHTKMVNDYLLVDDRMSMAHGVEERVPFLDRDLVDFGFSLPLHLKMHRGRPKALFRKSMEGLLPESIVRKKKWGFSVNPYLQYKKDLKGVVESVLSPEAVKREGLFNPAYIQRILDTDAHPGLRWHYNLLWIMAGLMIWKNMFIDSDRFKRREFNLQTYMSRENA